MPGAPSALAVADGGEAAAPTLDAGGGDSDDPAPLLVDTSALYARLDTDDEHHETARAVFDALQADELPYYPLYVTSHVLAELATLAMVRLDAQVAATALDRLRTSDVIEVLHPRRGEFDAAADGFADDPGAEVSLTDRLTAVAGARRGVDAVFAFDTDFEELGLEIVPGEDGGSGAVNTDE